VTQQPVWLIPLVAGLIYLLLFLLERRFPLRSATRSVWRRVGVNGVITYLALGTAAMSVSPAVGYLLRLSPEPQFGLLGVLNLPVALELGIAFVLFDWSFYWWHRANHHLPLLWRFHNVHHIDPDLDVTTAFRFHAVEIGYSAAFRAMQVLLIGPAAWMYFMYELVFISGTLFHHSNVKLPLQTERVLNKVFVTPRMHGIHHSSVRRETNSDYSTVFSCWDRLNRTIRLNVEQGQIRIGVPGYALEEDNRPLSLLQMPFKDQRPYWLDQDGIARYDRADAHTAGHVTAMQG
jgi:sterol desaturase/sphingolipid hydroxylase (fatty acid hydroxylase superfamily)